MKKKKTTKFNLKNYKKTVIFTVSIILFLFLTIFIFNDKINSLDATVQDFILNIRNDKLTNIMITITNISSAYSLIVLTILLIALIKNKKISLSLSLNLICVFIISQLTKIILRRPRPTDISLIDVTGFSYPSGHSMVSMAYYGFIAYLIYKNVKNKLLKTILITITMIMIFLVGFSRIYLGVHYLSDVIGGFLFAIAYLMIFIIVIKPYLNLDKKEQ